MYSLHLNRSALLVERRITEDRARPLVAFGLASSALWRRCYVITSLSGLDIIPHRIGF